MAKKRKLRKYQCNCCKTIVGFNAGVSVSLNLRCFCNGSSVGTPMQGVKEQTTPISGKRLRLFQQNPHCWHCGSKLKFEEATIEHITPRFFKVSNPRIALACRECQAEHGAHTSIIAQLFKTRDNKHYLGSKIEAEQRWIRKLGDNFVDSSVLTGRIEPPTAIADPFMLSDDLSDELPTEYL